jgi:hypothetical protein
MLLMKKKTKNRHRPVVDGSKLRRGMHVAVNYTEGTEHENWIGCGTFMRHVRPGMGWDYCLKIEPHCIVKTDSTDNGSCFPTRCVKPNEKDQV